MLPSTWQNVTTAENGKNARGISILFLTADVNLHPSQNKKFSSLKSICLNGCGMYHTYSHTSGQHKSDGQGEKFTWPPIQQAIWP